MAPGAPAGPADSRLFMLDAETAKASRFALHCNRVRLVARFDARCEPVRGRRNRLRGSGANPRRDDRNEGDCNVRAKLIAAVIVLLMVIVFTLQNAEVVSVRLLFWTLTVSRALLLFVVFGLGILAGWFFSGLSRRSADAE
jgi:uncharacterized integral membrane protein